jgi:hypothetical protein
MSKILCKHCGFDQNDIILSNCIVCKKPLPIADINSVSNDNGSLNYDIKF